MPLKASRRTFLGAAATSLSISLAGCSDVLAQKQSREGDGPFYLENYTTTGHPFSVIITHKQDGEELVNGRYHVPANHGVVFPEVGELGTTYRFAVAVDNLAPLTGDWSVSKCPLTQRGANSNTAGAFYVRVEKMGFAQNQCNDKQVGTSDELIYLSATEAAVADDPQ